LARSISACKERTSWCCHRGPFFSRVNFSGVLGINEFHGDTPFDRFSPVNMAALNVDWSEPSANMPKARTNNRRYRVRSGPFVYCDKTSSRISGRQPGLPLRSGYGEPEASTSPHSSKAYDSFISRSRVPHSTTLFYRPR
jgi:hypothetical protein